MKKVFCVLIVLCYTISSFAGCSSDYQKKISELSGKMNPPRTTVIANIGAEAVVVGTLASAGVLTIGAAIALPAAAFGAGSYLAFLAQQRKQMVDAKLTLDQAVKMKGPHWNKFVVKVQKKNPDADELDIQAALLRLDAEMVFCQEDSRKGTVKLIKPKKMKELVLAEI